MTRDEIRCKSLQELEALEAKLGGEHLAWSRRRALEGRREVDLMAREIDNQLWWVRAELRGRKGVE